MAAGGPVLSVITASRNRRELLLLKLQSLRNQDLQPGLFEWIVYLDGDADGSGEALEAELAARPPGFAVQVLHGEESSGPGQARNRAAELAAGRILHLSDDDCLLEPDCLRLHLHAQVEPAVYVGSIRFESEAGSEHWKPRRVGWWNVNGANTSMPATTFRETGGFPGYLLGYGGEDLGLGYQLEQAGLEVRALPQAVVRHQGADTRRSNNSEDRWYEAGANAMRLARRHPGMAGRLGVTRWQLALKRAVTPLMGRRGRLEAAYSRGARELDKGRT